MSTLNFNCANDPRDDAPTIIADNPPGGTQLAAHFEGVEGQPPNRWVVTVPEDITGGATVYYQKKQKDFRVIVPPGPGVWEAGQAPCLPPEYADDPEKVALIYHWAPTLLPLIVDGQFFRTNDGQPFTVIGCSDFAIWQRFSQGEDISPILAQRFALGFNQLRVFTHFCGGLGTFDGRAVVDTLRPFCSAVGLAGLRLELVVSADHSTSGWSNDDEVNWWQTVNALVAGYPHVTLEGINEGDHPANQTDAVKQFTNPSVLASRGSCVQDSGTMEPVLTYATYHPARGGDDWGRRVGHNAMEDVAEPHRIATVSNENKRPDEDGYHAYRFEDAARAAALLCAGSTFHSTSGKSSVLFSPDELPCAEAWVRGAKDVPLAFQRGQYRHRSDLETDEIVRAYSRVLSDGREYVVKIRA